MLAAGLTLLAVSIVAAGCVVGSGGPGSTVLFKAPPNPVAVKIDGRDVKLDELLKSPITRDSLNQFILFEHIRKQAVTEGVKVDPAEIDKKVEEQKQQVAGFGQPWDKFLFVHGVT